MFLAFFEVIAISWCYGVRRLCNNVKEMTGRAPSSYFWFCWLIAAPLLIMVKLIMILLKISKQLNLSEQVTVKIKLN